MQNFNEYQKEMCGNSFCNENKDKLFIYLLGLSGETGEVAEKFKKMLRDQNGEMTATFKEEVKKELGDVLWYVSAISHELGISLEDVAKANVEKINSRKARNVQHGNGDNR